MKTYRLERVYLADRTLGSLYDGATMIAKILELPWLENKRAISCIPEGVYMAIKQPPKADRPYTYFRLPKVEGRSGILMHIGNNPEHSKGCLLVGSRFANIETDTPILADSTAKMAWMALNMPDEFEMEIIKKPD